MRITELGDNMEKSQETVKQQQEIAQRQLQLMEQGFHLGKYKFKRNKFYDI